MESGGSLDGLEEGASALLGDITVDGVLAEVVGASRVDESLSEVFSDWTKGAFDPDNVEVAFDESSNCGSGVCDGGAEGSDNVDVAIDVFEDSVGDWEEDGSYGVGVGGSDEGTTLGNENDCLSINETSERERADDGACRWSGRGVDADEAAGNTGRSVVARVDGAGNGGSDGGGRGLCDHCGVGVPGWCNSDVDFDVVDYNNGGLSEVLAGGDRVDPETGLVVFVDIALIDVLEISSDVFVDNKVFVLLAPLL